MDYSQYFVVPAADSATVVELFDARRIIEDGKFYIVISEDQKLAAKLNAVLEFHNDEWAAWGFTVYAKGKQIAHGLFGENAESGVSVEDNCLEGDLDAAARLLGIDGKKLRNVVEADEPDVEKFMKAVGFGRYSITPYELDRETRGEKQKLFDPGGKSKPAKKRAVKRTAGKRSGAKRVGAKTSSKAKKR